MNKIVNRTIEKIKLIDEDLYLYFDIEAETIYFQYLREKQLHYRLIIKEYMTFGKLNYYQQLGFSINCWTIIDY